MVFPSTVFCVIYWSVKYSIGSRRRLRAKDCLCRVFQAVLCTESQWVGSTTSCCLPPYCCSLDKTTIRASRAIEPDLLLLGHGVEDLGPPNVWVLVTQSHTRSGKASFFRSFQDQRERWVGFGSGLVVGRGIWWYIYDLIIRPLNWSRAL